MADRRSITRILACSRTEEGIWSKVVSFTNDDSRFKPFMVNVPFLAMA
jgi:hypothetical protein